MLLNGSVSIKPTFQPLISDDSCCTGGEELRRAAAETQKLLDSESISRKHCKAN